MASTPIHPQHCRCEDCQDQRYAGRDYQSQMALWGAFTGCIIAGAIQLAIAVSPALAHWLGVAA